MATNPNQKTLLKTLLRKAKDRWDFGLTLVNSLMTLVTIFLTQYPDKTPEFIKYRDIAIALILVFYIVGIVHIHSRKVFKFRDEKKELNEQLQNQITINRDLKLSLSRQLENSNIIAQRGIQELFNKYKTIFLGNLDIPVTEGEFDVFNNICRSITLEIKNSIIDFLATKQIDIKNDITVSVKLILAPKNITQLYGTEFSSHKERVFQKDRWVITAFRDPDVFSRSKIIRHREVVSTLYSIEGNTAFREIFIGRNDRFCHDDLKHLQAQQLYENENPKWNGQYNSTLVVPIVLENARTDEARYLGFLAVDSLNLKKEALYTHEECYLILNHAALILSNYFLTVILYHDQGPSITKGSDI